MTNEIPFIIDLLFFILPVIAAVVSIWVAWSSFCGEENTCDRRKNKKYCETRQFKVMLIFSSIFLIICQFLWWGSFFFGVSDYTFISIGAKVTWLLYTVFTNLIFIIVMKNCEFQTLLRKQK